MTTSFFKKDAAWQHFVKRKEYYERLQKEREKQLTN